MSKYIWILLLALVISCDDAEDKAWNEAVLKNSTGAIDSFLNIYPESRYQTEANTKKDNYRWYIAKSKNTVYAYKKYLADYPSGLHKEEVPLYLDSIVSQEISLADLTKNSFVGKIDYGTRETQIIAFKFSEIQEDNDNIRFFAKINTSNIRKNLEGKINKKDFSIIFMEDPTSKTVLNLTDGRIYKNGDKLMMESTNISQYWNLIKYEN